MPMYNPPFIMVEVGRMVDGERRIKFRMTGNDAPAIAAALDTLDFRFLHKEESTGVIVFRRARDDSRAWYTQVKDHNPTEDQ